MANDATKAAAGITGAVAVDKLNTATPPTGTASALTGFVEVGYISDAGVTESRSRTVEKKRAWQNGEVVRVLVSEGSLTYKFVALETSVAVIESFYGITVTQISTEGSFSIKAEATGGRKQWVLTVLDGAEIERHFIPFGEVIDVGDKVYLNGELIGYELTIEAYYSSALGGQAKVYNTRLKS